MNSTSDDFDRYEKILQPIVSKMDPQVIDRLVEFCDATESIATGGDELGLVLKLSNDLETYMKKKDDLDQLISFNEYLEGSIADIDAKSKKLDEERRRDSLEREHLEALLSQKSQETEFLRRKCNKYKSDVKKYEAELDSRGFCLDKINFDRFKEKDEQILKGRLALGKLEKQLSCFKNLPADIYLAEMKLEEKREELRAIEQELNKVVNSMSDLKC